MRTHTQKKKYQDDRKTEIWWDTHTNTFLVILPSLPHSILSLHLAAIAAILFPDKCFMRQSPYPLLK